ncbi:MAG: flagellar motor switch protein FliN [Bacteriovoracaceae bacterium]|jgi:flagellar motor switch protein FliN|nr:flagellar motor switch protein FliN [Bacteriovoracaceae bacterium]
MDESIADMDGIDIEQPEQSSEGDSAEEYNEEAAALLQQEFENFEFILDVPLPVRAELGQCDLNLRELMQVGQGTVLELNKLAGEPMEVYVNDRLIAKGEVLMVGEKFGVRLTDINSPLEKE